MDASFLRPELLEKSTFLSTLPADQLTWLAENGERITIEKGQVIITENTLQDAFYVVLDGEMEVVRGDQGEVLLAVQGSGQVLGEMSAIADVPSTATVRACCHSHLLKINRQLFSQLILNNPATALELLRTALVRLRNSESVLGQREKLASLGTLAAGLAHELNNPSAAARRSAGQLRQTVAESLDLLRSMLALDLGPHLDDNILPRLISDLVAYTAAPPKFDPIDRSDRESELEAWLEDHGLQNAWQCAPYFVTFKWTPAELDAWSADFAPQQIPAVLRWMANGYMVRSLLDEILTSTERINEIVKAIKSYTYLDQAPMKEVDLHEGLESTLVILQHKLKQGVTVQRSYDPNLPPVTVYASELNQVWTNLVDNAIDAMNGEGILRLRTAVEGGWVVVEIGDNGPGIPAEVRGRLFEPFFTTKEPGKGTGLGLHVTYNLVQKNRGRIDVSSVPGDTRFKVCLPLTP